MSITTMAVSRTSAPTPDVVVVANTMEAAAEITPPFKNGTDPYQFEMIFDDGKGRAYADDPDALLTVLIGGYGTMTEPARLAARLHLAVRTQTTLQAVIIDHVGLEGVTPEEYAVLMASRATPPDVNVWTCEVPLVLVDSFYAPHGSLPVPISGKGDVDNPDNLLWLRPHDPFEFLVSLHEVGLVGLFAHADYLP